MFSCITIYLIFAESELFRTFVGEISELKHYVSQLKSKFFISEIRYVFCLLMDEKINLVCIKGLCESSYKLKVCKMYQ